MKSESFVSVVVVTYDRPVDLEATLSSIDAQQTAYDYECIVVDNHPSSGITRPVMGKFPQFRYVSGPGRGLCSGRNLAANICQGDLILWTNDDVVLPCDWIERFASVFTRDDVMVVTGNVHPYCLEAKAAQLFDRYNGFTRGAQPVDYTGRWLKAFVHKSAPTQCIGIGNNFATRRACFDNRRIGLFNEVLGAGTSVGSADDQYFFYRVLRSGHTIHYEPTIVIQDRYPENAEALYQKLYTYGKAMIGYELEILTRDRDWRALLQLFIVLPADRLRNAASLLWGRLRSGRWPEYAPLFVQSLRGNLAGLPAWLSARRRAQAYAHDTSSTTGQRPRHRVRFGTGLH